MTGCWPMKTTDRVIHKIWPIRTFTFVCWTKKNKENNNVLAGRSLLLPSQDSRASNDPFPPVLRPVTQTKFFRSFNPVSQETFHWDCDCLPGWLHFRTHGRATVNRNCLYRFKKVFDFLDYHCLLHNLTWFRNYLIAESSIRKGIISSSSSLDVGVPQGSLLIKAGVQMKAVLWFD